MHSIHTHSVQPANSQILALSWTAAYSCLLVAYSRYCSIPLFCELCSLGTLCCSWLVGAFESELMSFFREILLSVSSIANANITFIDTSRGMFPQGACQVRGWGGHGKDDGHVPVSLLLQGTLGAGAETSIWLWQPSWHRSSARASSFLTTGFSGS